MAFESLGAFFAMGGYALYVWLSVGATLLSIGVLWLHGRLRRRQLFQQVIQAAQRRERIKQAQQEKQYP